MWMLFCQTHLDCSVIKVYGTLVRRATCVVVMSVSYTCDASFWQLDRCVLYELWGRVMWYVSFNVNGWCHHVWWRHVVLPALWGPNIVSDKQHIILKWGRFEKKVGHFWRARTFLWNEKHIVSWVCPVLASSSSCWTVGLGHRDIHCDGEFFNRVPVFVKITLEQFLCLSVSWQKMNGGFH